VITRGELLESRSLAPVPPARASATPSAWFLQREKVWPRGSSSKLTRGITGVPLVRWMSCMQKGSLPCFGCLRHVTTSTNGRGRRRTLNLNAQLLPVAQGVRRTQALNYCE